MVKWCAEPILYLRLWTIGNMYIRKNLIRRISTISFKYGYADSQSIMTLTRI